MKRLFKSIIINESKCYVIMGNSYIIHTPHFETSVYPQLYCKYRLSDVEVAFVEGIIKVMG